MLFPRQQLLIAQLSGRQSLRDIEANRNAQTGHRYHLRVGRVARGSLARVNERQPDTLYLALFGQLRARRQALVPRHEFRFKNPLYSLDASPIKLVGTLSVERLHPHQSSDEATLQRDGAFLS